MKRTIAALVFCLVALATIASGDGPPAGMQTWEPSGEMITRDNIEKFLPMLPAGLADAIRHGMTVRIVPSRRLDWPSQYQQATEKYSGQVVLGSNDSIQNYAAGLPFPSITPPGAGAKVAYNWRWGPFIPTEASVDSSQKTRAFHIDAASPDRLIADDSQRDYRNESDCDRMLFVHYSGVTSGSARDGVNYRERGDECGPDRGAAIETEYMDPARDDDVWFFVPSVRRWRQTELRGGYPHQSCTYSCVQFAWEYAPPKTEVYEYRLIGKQPVVGCLDAPAVGSGIDDIREPARFEHLDCEIRDAYVIDMQPRQASPERVIPASVYIDAETYLYLGAEIYRDSTPDSDFPIWSRSNSGGETRMILANDFYWPADRPDFLIALNLTSDTVTIDAADKPAALFNPRAQQLSDGRM